MPKRTIYKGKKKWVEEVKDQPTKAKKEVKKD